MCLAEWYSKKNQYSVIDEVYDLTNPYIQNKNSF